MSILEEELKELKKINSNNNLIIACTVANGLGDFFHGLELANGFKQRENKITVGGVSHTYNPTYLFLFNKNDPPEKIQLTLASLKDHGLLKEVSDFKGFDSPKQFMQTKFLDYLAQIMKENPSFHFIWNSPEFIKKFGIVKTISDRMPDGDLIEGYVDAVNPLLKKQVQEAAGIIYASHFRTDALSQYTLKPIQPIYLAEHNSEHLYFMKKSLNLITGFGENSEGVFLNPSKPLSTQEKSKLLTQFHNKKFVQDLLQIEGKASDFSDHHFVPGYLHTKFGTSVFIQSIATSSSAKNAKYCDFVINEKGFDPSMLDSKLLAEQGFAEIEIINAGEKSTIKLKESGRKLRIFTGYSLDDHDYDAMFKLASGIGGCSGDKTLEKCISHYLIPFYEQDKDKVFVTSNLISLVDKHKAELVGDKKENKEELLTNLKDFIKLFGKIGAKTGPVRKVSDEKMKAEIADVSQKLAKLLTPKLIEMWQKFNKIIQDNYNLNNKLDNFFLKSVAYFHLQNALNQKNFSLAKKIIEPFYQNEPQFLYRILQHISLKSASTPEDKQVAAFIYSNFGDAKFRNRPLKEIFASSFPEAPKEVYQAPTQTSTLTESAELNLEPAAVRLSGELNIEPASQRSSGEINFEPAPQRSSGEINLEPAPQRSSGELNLEPAPESPRGELNLEPAPESPSGELNLEPAPESLSGELNLEPAPESPSEELNLEPAPESNVLSVESQTAAQTSRLQRFLQQTENRHVSRLFSGTRGVDKKDSKAQPSIVRKNSRT